MWIQWCSCLDMEILSDYLNLAAMMLQHSSMDMGLKQGYCLPQMSWRGIEYVMRFDLKLQNCKNLFSRHEI